MTDSGYFEYAQGHANAFGISIPDKNLHSFHQYANEALKDIDFGTNVYDVNFERYAFSDDLADLVEQLGRASSEGIWGQGCPEPVIHVTRIPIDSTNIRVMGTNKDTVKIVYNNVAFMKFRAKDLLEELDQHQGPITLEIVGRANLNEYMGTITPQIFIDDFEIHETKEKAAISWLDF